MAAALYLQFDSSAANDLLTAVCKLERAKRKWRAFAAFDSLSPDSPTQMFKINLETLISRIGLLVFLSFCKQQALFSVNLDQARNQLEV